MYRIELLKKRDKKIVEKVKFHILLNVTDRVEGITDIYNDLIQKGYAESDYIMGMGYVCETLEANKIDFYATVIK